MSPHLDTHHNHSEFPHDVQFFLCRHNHLIGSYAKRQKFAKSCVSAFQTAKAKAVDSPFPVCILHWLIYGPSLLVDQGSHNLEVSSTF